MKKSAQALFRPFHQNGLGADRAAPPQVADEVGRRGKGKAMTHKKDLRTKKSPAATYFRAARALSSAQESLTSVFGMGTGIASPPWPPDIINEVIVRTKEEKSGRLKA